MGRRKKKKKNIAKQQDAKEFGENTYDVLTIIYNQNPRSIELQNAKEKCDSLGLNPAINMMCKNHYNKFYNKEGGFGFHEPFRDRDGDLGLPLNPPQDGENKIGNMSYRKCNSEYNPKKKVNENALCKLGVNQAIDKEHKKESERRFGNRF